jgi:hypothetical protein
MVAISNVWEGDAALCTFTCIPGSGHASGIRAVDGGSRKM